MPVDIRDNFRILQYGCGFGGTVNQLYSEGFKNIYGVDHAEKMIESAQKQYPYLSKNFAVCESMEVPFPKNFFDVVILNQVLTCVIKDEDQKSLIQRIAEVLKPDAIFYICDFFITPQEYDVDRYNRYHKGHKGEVFGVFESSDGILFKHHDPAWILELTKGFEQIAFQEIKCATLHGRKINGFYFLGKNRK